VALTLIFFNIISRPTLSAPTPPVYAGTRRALRRARTWNPATCQETNKIPLPNSVHPAAICAYWSSCSPFCDP